MTQLRGAGPPPKSTTKPAKARLVPLMVSVALGLPLPGPHSTPTPITLTPFLSLPFAGHPRPGSTCCGFWLLAGSHSLPYLTYYGEVKVPRWPSFSHCPVIYCLLLALRLHPQT
ncbi:hypothetical protein BJ166DRAFT_141123 [Pestalotiopsis sp. NC0098]|nr:hypothetical protein BJ166DRAFT_141123 [Pestalotiopsis sp. NC0098]